MLEVVSPKHINDSPYRRRLAEAGIKGGLFPWFPCARQLFLQDTVKNSSGIKAHEYRFQIMISGYLYAE